MPTAPPSTALNTFLLTHLLSEAALTQATKS